MPTTSFLLKIREEMQDRNVLEIMRTDKHKVLPLDSLRGAISESQEIIVEVILVVPVPWFLQLLGRT